MKGNEGSSLACTLSSGRARAPPADEMGECAADCEGSLRLWKYCLLTYQLSDLGKSPKGSDPRCLHPV